MERLKVKIVSKSKHKLPEYSTPLSAGMDIKANIDNDILLRPLERVLVPTGLFIELPVGYEAQIRSRSGLALKHGVSSLNDPGTIDADFRGEIRILLINLSNTDFVIRDGERICQMIISRHERTEWLEVDELKESIRGGGGFGHTGKG